MQQVFVKDIKDSTLNVDVLAKLKKDRIPLHIYWHNEPEAKFLGVFMHDFNKFHIDVEIAGRYLQFTRQEMIDGDITVEYALDDKYHNTEDILVRNEGYRINENLTVGDPIHIWINKKDHTQIDADVMITHIDYTDRIQFICNSFTNPELLQSYSIYRETDSCFTLVTNDLSRTRHQIYNPTWCPLVPRDPDEEEDVVDESCDE